MKNILGLDLGVNSIGWAIVKEGEDADEKSSIVDCGVRVVPLTIDEHQNFEKGESYSVNQVRTECRGARRRLQRYKLRRKVLLDVLKRHKVVDPKQTLAEDGARTTHQQWNLRALAATEKISLHNFARVLLAINKKRGYKSNRKANEDGTEATIDGVETAKLLQVKNLTPGQFGYQELLNGKKQLPDFYPSDLQKEWDQIWDYQHRFYSNALTMDLKDELRGKSKKVVWFKLKEILGIEGITPKGDDQKPLKGKALKQEHFRLRSVALAEKLDAELVSIVFQDLAEQISQASGYLGNISDRSKILYMENLTIGEYGWRLLQQNANNRLKGQVFFRQDYVDEFEKVWETQAKFHPDVLTAELKSFIQDIIIFYQRPLRSQKGLVNTCEFESKIRNVTCAQTGDTKAKKTGPRVIPKSNGLFQQFKYWQTINNIEIRNKSNSDDRIGIADLDDEFLTIRNELAAELDLKGKLTANEVIKVLGKKPREWELNFADGIDGNRTNAVLFRQWRSIFQDELNTKKNADLILQQLTTLFGERGWESGLLTFNSDLDGQAIEQQPAWRLWHLLYSYTGDQSRSGIDGLVRKLVENFGFDPATAKKLANIQFEEGYANLSARAIRKILTFLKAGHSYSDACVLAGYRHSNWVTKQENLERKLKPRLELVPKNSLRNPVVEKILNQTVHIVNGIVERHGHPDEIRIEFARELKKSLDDRKQLKEAIDKATSEHGRIRKEIENLPQFQSNARITRNDIVKYKLWEELKDNGFKTLYSQSYIAKEKIFSGDFDVEHIIPKAIMFDDSFSNKTLERRDINAKKSNQTAMQFIIDQPITGLMLEDDYRLNVESLFNNGKGRISRAKRNKLLMRSNDIDGGFLERDLRNTQYIARKAMEMLYEVTRQIVPTTGAITSKLREDWGLVNVLKEINLPIYQKLGLTNVEEIRSGADAGKKIEVISHWSKRDDQRHHAMDALTIAFTKRAHVQYLNHLNARSNEDDKLYFEILGIEKRHLRRDNRGRLRFVPPMPAKVLREEFRRQLSMVLVSYKAKNKVTTLNQNRTKRKGVTPQIQIARTPRGALHKDSVYASSRYYETKNEKIGSKFNSEKISLVAKKAYREALERRLAEFDGDPKKAFSGANALTKQPVFIDKALGLVVPPTVMLQWLTPRFTIRKPISPELKVEKVVDKGVKRVLEKRLAECNGEAKVAFGNLDENPIWINEAKGIAIKSVTITGVKNAVPIHFKRNHLNATMLDVAGEQRFAGFVQTSNNHHVAIYRNREGKLEQECVSFFEVVRRVQTGKLIIDRDLNRDIGWEFLYTMKQNEMFVFGDSEFDPHAIDVFDENHRAEICRRLFRVQAISLNDFRFRHHLETTVERKNNDGSKIDEKPLQNQVSKRIRSTLALDKENPIKIRLNHLGKIVHVGEY